MWSKCTDEEFTGQRDVFVSESSCQSRRILKFYSKVPGSHAVFRIHIQRLLVVLYRLSISPER